MASPKIDEVYGTAGYFRIFVRNPSGSMTDITTFRGKPIQVGSMSTTDPFGDATASLSIPQITGRDKPGQGDLWWLVPWASVDIMWYDDLGVPTGFVWEGLISSEDIEDGYSVALKGALYQADNYLAKPWYPQHPIPYELLISQALDPKQRAGLRTGPVQVVFPDNWKTLVPNRKDPDYLSILRPWGVQTGAKWTGLATRNTGGWEPLLTGFVQSLLSIMYTEDGSQWTIRKLRGRIPQLVVRPQIIVPDKNTLHVYYGVHGVRLSASRDFSASANIIYGAGKDLAGTAFSGQQVSRDGQTTYYEPFAYLPAVWPSNPANPRLNTNIVRKEARLQFPEGVSHLDADLVAANHLRRFADPGYTATLTLSTDPLLNDVPFPRQLIKAGSSIVVHGFRDTDMLFHITETNGSPMTGEMSLTLDSKYRDALTVYEVRAQTRDALDPIRLLRAGQFSVTVQDSIMPWSYTQGSGVVPSGGTLDATPFFNTKVGTTEKFPWTESTLKYPPKKYPAYYVKIGAKNAVADRNWSTQTRSGISYAAIPVRLSQAGTIRLTQIAAYDADGNVKPVRFHVGFYSNGGVSVTDMPMIPTAMAGTYGYPASNRYPFFPGAFENINANGTQTTNPGQLTANGADMLVGFGNYYEAAGYFPGLASRGSAKTGLLSDESPWSFDMTGNPNFDKYDAAQTRKDPTNGMGYVLIYCDDQGTSPIYFLGRLWVTPQGA